jgi:hypothetical protein
MRHDVKCYIMDQHHSNFVYIIIIKLSHTLRLKDDELPDAKRKCECYCSVKKNKSVKCEEDGAVILKPIAYTPEEYRKVCI